MRRVGGDRLGGDTDGTSLVGRDRHPDFLMFRDRHPDFVMFLVLIRNFLCFSEQALPRVSPFEKTEPPPTRGTWHLAGLFFATIDKQDE